MPKPALSTRERLITLATADVASAPADNALPHIVLSPHAPGGGVTAGFLFGVFAPQSGAAVPAATADDFIVVPGFAVTIWRLNTTHGQWMAGAMTTGIAFRKQYVSWDVSGSHALWFQFHTEGVETDGGVILSVGEMS